MCKTPTPKWYYVTNTVFKCPLCKLTEKPAICLLCLLCIGQPKPGALFAVLITILKGKIHRIMLSRK